MLCLVLLRFLFWSSFSVVTDVVCGACCEERGLSVCPVVSAARLRVSGRRDLGGGGGVILLEDEEAITPKQRSPLERRPERNRKGHRAHVMLTLQYYQNALVIFSHC